MNRVYVLLMFFIMFPVQANIEIEYFAAEELNLAEKERSGFFIFEESELDAKKFDPFEEFRSDYGKMLNSIRIPTLKAKPKLTYDITLNDGFVDYQRSVKPIDIEKSKLPFHDLYRLQSSDTKKKAYLVYKCDAQKKKASNFSSQLDLSTNFSGLVDGWVQEIGDAENEIKSQVSKQISGFFQNITRLLSPGYVTEQIIKIFATNLATFTCKACETTKIGCGNVFLLAEIKKDPQAEARYKELGVDIGKVRLRETQEGSIMDANIGSADCPTWSIIKVKSGIVSGSGTHTKTITERKKQTFAENDKKRIDDQARNKCVRTEYGEILDVIKTAISIAQGSLRAVIETQQSCKDENSNKITLYEKSSYAKEVKRNYFKNINYFIENSVNAPGQKITNTVMDSLDSAIKIINNDTVSIGIEEEIGKVLKEREKSLTANASQLDKYEFIKDKITNSSSSTAIKSITGAMMGDIFDVSRFSTIGKKNFSKLIECKGLKMIFDGSSDGLEIDCIGLNKKATIADKAKIFQLQDELYTDLDFYNKVFMDALIAGVPSNSSLMCNEFNEDDLENRDLCYRVSYIEHLTGFSTAELLPGQANTSCECNGYDMLLDLIPNPYNTARVLMNSQGLTTEAMAKSSAPGAGYLDDLNMSLNQLRQAFILSMASYISTVQSKQNYHLHKLGLLVQTEIRDQLKEYFELMRM